MFEGWGDWLRSRRDALSIEPSTDEVFRPRQDDTNAPCQAHIVTLETKIDALCTFLNNNTEMEEAATFVNAPLSIEFQNDLVSLARQIREKIELLEMCRNKSGNTSARNFLYGLTKTLVAAADRSYRFSLICCMLITGLYAYESVLNIFPGLNPSIFAAGCHVTLLISIICLLAYSRMGRESPFAVITGFSTLALALLISQRGQVTEYRKSVTGESTSDFATVLTVNRFLNNLSELHWLSFGSR